MRDCLTALAIVAFLSDMSEEGEESLFDIIKRLASSIGIAATIWLCLWGAMKWRNFAGADLLDQLNQGRFADVVENLSWLNWSGIPTIAAFANGAIAYIWMKHKLEQVWARALGIIPAITLVVVADILFA